MGCLGSSLSVLTSSLDDLQYQLELSDSIDSGNGTDDEQLTDADDGSNACEFTPCPGCKKIISPVLDLCNDTSAAAQCKHALIKRPDMSVNVTQGILHCLSRASSVVLSSRCAIRRLRHLCCKLRSRQSNLEERLVHVQKARAEVTRQAHEAQAKLNDNFKLMTELSNENVRLAAENAAVLGGGGRGNAGGAGGAPGKRRHGRGSRHKLAHKRRDQLELPEVGLACPHLCGFNS